MKIAVWPADEMGCGEYRLMMPARALAAQGIDAVIDRRGPTIEWTGDWSHLKTPPPSVHVVRCRPYDADVVVMQRPARQHWAELIPHLKAQGIRVVVDVDDLFDAIDRRNIAHHAYQSYVFNHRYIEACCKMADLVTCTTPALLKRYGFGHGVILPNLVPESYLSIFGLKRPDTVGWSGFVATHPGDLEVTEGVIASSLRDDWTFHVVGPGDGVAEGLRLPRPEIKSIEVFEDPTKYGRLRQEATIADSPQLTATGRLVFDEYALAVAELEIGIVPLCPTPFNQAKSALKAAEMAALGVPCIMSPTPDNLRLHKLGVGLIAESRGQWRRYLSHLIGSVDARYELAAQGREVMATQTYELKSELWLEAWTTKSLVAV